MEWTDDEELLGLFATLISESRPHIDRFMERMSERGFLGNTPPWLTFILAAKFVVVYDSTLSDLESVGGASDFARNHLAWTKSLMTIMEDPILHAVVQMGVQGMQ